MNHAQYIRFINFILLLLEGANDIHNGQRFEATNHTVYKIFPLYCVFFFIGKERDFTDGGGKKIMVVL